MGWWREESYREDEEQKPLFLPKNRTEQTDNSPGCGGAGAAGTGTRAAAAAGSAARCSKAAMAARLYASLVDRAPSSGELNFSSWTRTVARKRGEWSGPSRVCSYTGGAHRRCWHISCSRDLNIFAARSACWSLLRLKWLGFLAAAENCSGLDSMGLTNVGCLASVLSALARVAGWLPSRFLAALPFQWRERCRGWCLCRAPPPWLKSAPYLRSDEFEEHVDVSMSV